MEHYVPASRAGDVGLVDIGHALWAQRVLVMVIAAVIGALALAYAMLSQPVYRTFAVLYPPSPVTLNAIERSGIYSLSPVSAFQRVAVALDSYEARAAYFKQWSAEHPEQLQNSDDGFTTYNDRLRVVVSDPAKVVQPQLKVEFDYAKDVRGADYLNGYVSYVLAREAAEINGELKTVIATRIAEIDQGLEVARAAYQASKASRIAQLRENDEIRKAQLNDELKALRQQIKTAREDRIATLAEAEGIARRLGIQKLVTPADLTQLDGNRNVISTELNYNNNPLYFMGVEALQAERNALASRKNDEFTEPRIAQIAKELSLLSSNREIQAISGRAEDDLFMAETQAKRRELALLQTFDKSLEVTDIVKVDRPAMVPTSPIKPNRLAIIVFGVVFGIILGLLSALARFFIAQSRRVSQAGVAYETAPALMQAAPGAILVRD